MPPETTMTPIRLYLLGAGGVGREVLRQLGELRGTTPRPFRLCGLANSRHMRLAEDGIPFGVSATALDSAPTLDLAKYRDFVADSPGARVIIDTTASDAVAETLCALREHGVIIVAANKHPFAGRQDVFDRLTTPQSDGRPGCYFETTAGAGLPVVQTVISMTNCGDVIHRIEGLFSGTLTFVLDQVRQGVGLKDALRRAFELGYTEPDPREDLSGMDVGRKLLILARAARARLEPEDVSIVSLLDPSLADVALSAFWERASIMDEPMAEAAESAHGEGGSLAYLARFEGRSAQVSLQAVSAAHPAAGVQGTDNVFAITSERYPSPLVIRGAGAGREVTAQGVVSDILLAGSRLL